MDFPPPSGKRGPILLIVALAGVYLLSYLALTRSGAYAPAVWGEGGVKRYRWAPAGFYKPDDGGWNESLWCWLYMPLWLVDTKLWHSKRLPDDSDPKHPDTFPKRKRRAGAVP